MTPLLTDRYRDRLAGVLSCYDRIVITGTLPGATDPIPGAQLGKPGAHPGFSFPAADAEPQAVPLPGNLDPRPQMDVLQS